MADTFPSFVRLERDIPWKTGIGCTALLGLVPSALGGGILVQSWRHWKSWGDDFVVVIVGGAFALVGLGLILMAIHQAFAIRVAETEVSIDRPVLAPGMEARVRVRQPGPVNLLSLNGRLVCEVRKRRTGRNGKHSYSSTYPYQERIFEIRGGVIPENQSLDHESLFTVPPGAEATLDTPELKRIWRLEVWGRVRHWPDFMHPFTVDVRPHD